MAWTTYLSLVSILIMVKIKWEHSDSDQGQVWVVFIEFNLWRTESVCARYSCVLNTGKEVLHWVLTISVKRSVTLSPYHQCQKKCYIESLPSVSKDKEAASLIRCIVASLIVHLPSRWHWKPSKHVHKLNTIVLLRSLLQLQGWEECPCQSLHSVKSPNCYWCRAAVLYLAMVTSKLLYRL